MRGKRRVDRQDQIDMLTELLDIARLNSFGPALEVKIMIALQSALTDFSSSGHIKPDAWVTFLDNMFTLTDILVKNVDQLKVSDSITEDNESLENAPFLVQGSIVTLTEKMDEEFVRLLQMVDAHSPDYIERLKDENRVMDIIGRVRQYLEHDGLATPLELCRVFILYIDYIYYKFDVAIVEANKNVGEFHNRDITLYKLEDDAPPKVADETDLNKQQIIGRLCKFIYLHDTTKRINKLATLYQVYNYALHDCWYEARDLMLMSQLPQTIIQAKSDIQLQVLYNRALVQLGLCAFRHGNIFEAHSSLLDILLKGRVRELLAQGLGE